MSTVYTGINSPKLDYSFLNSPKRGMTNSIDTNTSNNLAKKLSETEMLDFYETTSVKRYDDLEFIPEIEKVTFGDCLIETVEGYCDSFKGMLLKGASLTQKGVYGLSIVSNICSKLNITSIVATVSLVEGLSKFVESLVDCVAIVGTGLISIVSAPIDLIAGLDYTDYMYEQVYDFIEKDHVGGFFDWFYSETKLGSYLEDNSYLFNPVRTISTGIGYVAAVIIVGTLTGGGSLEAQGVSAAALAVPAFLGGVGKGAENAYQNDAKNPKGTLSALINGAWEGLQFYLGGKINGLSIFESDIANILTRIGLDTLDGGAEGFVQPAIASIFSSSYYDEETGQWVEFEEDDSIIDKYLKKWDEQGGIKQVMTYALMGGLMSSASELFGYVTKNTKLKYETKKIDSDNLYIKEIEKYVNNSKITQSNINKYKKIYGDGLQYLSSKDISVHVAEMFGINIADNPNSLLHDTSICYKYFDDISRGKGYLDTLQLNNPEQYLAVRSYTSNQFNVINNGLLRKYLDAYEKYAKEITVEGKKRTTTQIINSLDEFINSTTLKNDLIVFRGTDINQFSNLGIKDISEIESLVGKQIISKDYGYMSTTPVMGKGFTNGSDVVLVMRVPEGNHVAFVDPISMYKGEMETILPRGTEGIISGVEKIKNGTKDQVVVYMDILPEKGKLTTPEVLSDIKFSSFKDIEKYVKNKFDIESFCKLTGKEKIEQSKNLIQSIDNYFTEILDKKNYLSAYRELINLSELKIDIDFKNNILNSLISKNKHLRKVISEQAYVEVAQNLSKVLGIKDTNIISAAAKSLLGDSFIESGVGKSYNWDRFISIIAPYVKENVKKQTKISKPILWSKVNEMILNSKFINTIENSTGGEFPFMNIVYNNWDSTTSTIPRLEEYWKKLSKLYATACSDALGEGSSIKYIYLGDDPVTGGINKGFGNIFKTTELPEIIKNGKIDSIELNVVEPNTLDTIGVKTVDLKEIREYAKSEYLDKGLEINSDDIFEKFIKKVDE